MYNIGRNPDCFPFRSVFDCIRKEIVQNLIQLIKVQPGLYLDWFYTDFERYILLGSQRAEIIIAKRLYKCTGIPFCHTQLHFSDIYFPEVENLLYQAL